MLVTPRWKRKSDGGRLCDVGFKIMDAPWDWVAFIRETISEDDYDLDHGYNA